MAVHGGFGMSERIGIIGLGRMGSALAAKAVTAGFSVAGWTRSGGNRTQAEAAGYGLADTFEGLVAGADLLLLSLFDDAAVAEVLCALAETDLSGKLVVETSTVSPSVVRDHASAIEAAGGRLIDAPISGGPEMVAAGTMGLFIGGADTDAARFLPVAQKLSNRVAHIGALGDGAAAKIVNNVALAGAFSAALDAMRLGRAMGLETEPMVAFLEKSPGTTPMFKSRAAAILGQDDTVGFPIEGAVKDARVFLGEADRQGIDLPSMVQIAHFFEQAEAAGLGGQDVAAIGRFLLDD